MLILKSLKYFNFFLLLTLSFKEITLSENTTSAFFAAFFGSIQDVAVDALRIEIGDAKGQGDLAASYQLGYRIAILVATSMALIFADLYNWSYVYQFMCFRYVCVIRFQNT